MLIDGALNRLELKACANVYAVIECTRVRELASRFLPK